MHPDQRKLALDFLTELEKAIKAIRTGDVDSLAYAEIQLTLLYLLEKSPRIHELLRTRYSRLSYKGEIQGAIIALADSDYELATLISGLFETLFDLLHRSGPA